MKLLSTHFASRSLAGLLVATLIALGSTTARGECSCGAGYVGDMPCDTAGCDGCSDSYCGDSCCGDSCGGGCGKSGCSGLRNLLGGGCGDGDCGCAPGTRGYGQPDLFYNFYTQGNANRVNAQMYLSPLPVPPNVGHTFYTYQPFYPHNMLYWHKERYHRYYDNGRGMNRTMAVYYSPPVRQFISNLYWNKLRLPR